MPKKTFEIADEQKAIFITQVKDNHRGLLTQLEHGTKVNKCIDNFSDEIEKRHGRLDLREYEVFESKSILKKWPEWHRIRSIIRVTRRREVYNRREKTYRKSEEISYYVCNRFPCKKLTAKRFGEHIRQHWFIENKVHYVKDVSFREDSCRKEVNPTNFSTIIDFAMNILRYNGEKNIKAALYNISLNATKYWSTLDGLVC